MKYPAIVQAFFYILCSAKFLVKFAPTYLHTPFGFAHLVRLLFFYPTHLLDSCEIPFSVKRFSETLRTNLFYPTCYARL